MSYLFFHFRPECVLITACHLNRIRQKNIDIWIIEGQLKGNRTKGNIL